MVQNPNATQVKWLYTSYQLTDFELNFHLDKKSMSLVVGLTFLMMTVLPVK